MPTPEENDAIIKERYEKLNKRIADAKEIIRRNENAIDSLLVWRPTPKQQREIDELDEQSEREEKFIEENEPLAREIEKQMAKLEELKNKFERYADLFEYLEISFCLQAALILVIHNFLNSLFFCFLSR